MLRFSGRFAGVPVLGLNACAACAHVLVFIWTKATFSEAKDEAGNDYNDILWMLQKSQTTTWDGAKTL